MPTKLRTGVNAYSKRRPNILQRVHQPLLRTLAHVDGFLKRRLRAHFFFGLVNTLSAPLQTNQAARPPLALKNLALGAAALGALAIGAMAVGALAIGALGIGRLLINQGSIRKLHIGELTVDRLRVRTRQ